MDRVRRKGESKGLQVAHQPFGSAHPQRYAMVVFAQTASSCYGCVFPQTMPVLQICICMILHIKVLRKPSGHPVAFM